MVCTYCATTLSEADLERIQRQRGNAKQYCAPCWEHYVRQPGWMERRLIDFKAPWRSMFDYRGRATRSEKWVFTLVSLNLVFLVVLMLYSAALNTANSPVEWIMSILLLVVVVATVLATLSLTVRRFHDIGLTGYFTFLWLLILIPIVNVITYLAWVWVLGLIQSRPENRWGPKRCWR